MENNPKDTTDKGLPMWFLENCTKTAKELKRLKHLLRVLEFEPTSVTKSKPRSQPGGYKVEPCIYDSLRTIATTATDGTTRFDKNIVYLKQLIEWEGHEEYISALVSYFAADIGANLICLSEEDVRDIAEELDGVDSNHDGIDPILSAVLGVERATNREVKGHGIFNFTTLITETIRRSSEAALDGSIQAESHTKSQKSGLETHNEANETESDNDWKTESSDEEPAMEIAHAKPLIDLIIQSPATKDKGRKGSNPQNSPPLLIIHLARADAVF